MDIKKDIYKKAHNSSFKNKESILKSKQCGCFHCGSIFMPSSINEWAKEGTALCPFCHIDSIICDNDGFPITPDFLVEMMEEFFNRKKS